MATQIEGYPLSEQQKRLWHLQQSQGLPSMAVIRMSLRGALDRSALSNALLRLVQRHEILRTSFKGIPGLAEPVQVVAEEPGIAELDQLSPSFAWRETPALRYHLEQGADNSWSFTIALPALAADQTTGQLLAAEIAAEYGRVLAGTQSDSEPMQYLDYGQWQADLQESPEARAGHTHWNNHPIAEAPEWKLPLEKPNEGKKFRVQQCSVALDSQTGQQLDAVAASLGVDRETFLFAAWAAFCGRLAESPEVVVAFHQTGRNFQELESALGPYDRFLPARLVIKENTTLLDFVRIAAGERKSAMQHQEFFRLMQGTVRRHPAAAIAFGSTPPAFVSREGGVDFSLSAIELTPEPYKLFLQANAGASQELALLYNAECFDSSAAELLAERFAAFLPRLLAQPDAPLQQVSVLGKKERELILEEFASSPAAPPEFTHVLELVERQAATHPSRTAVLCDGQSLSYAELESRSNQLANHLIKIGVQNGAPVALSAERSVEMIIGLLGILKAGGAYVPIDPAYPQDRIAFVLKDVNASVLVLQPHLMSKFPPHSCKMVALCATHSALNQESTAHPGSRISADALAYVIYTSGSTGQPKGVPISHRNLACSTAARLHFYKEPVTAYLLLSSFAFDSSIAGIFWTLMQGGTLTLPREGAQADPAELLRLIESSEVSHLLALPSLYNALLEQSGSTQLASLKTVIVAGESCPPALVQRHYTKSAATLFNEYGPTEATVWSTVHLCDRNSHLPLVPIGRPVPNSSIYILDSRMEPAPIGAQGEIHVAGEALSAGYLNRPDLTTAKFVPNPFQGGGRLYKTGDLGRFMLDGAIEFLGRIDQQVKIRGYRIELGEIEAVLTGHPSVKEAVVLAREDAPGDKRLVAYIVSQPGLHPSIPDLRLFLQEKLPPFMVPAQFATIQAFPLTPNGKVDRKALPAPEELEKGTRREYIAPRSPDEEVLANIWAEVLKLERVGAEENFFDLGGHSLLAIQVIARVRESLKVEIPMRTFFDTPTVAGMALALDRCRQTKAAPQTTIRRLSRPAASENPALQGAAKSN